MLAVLDEMGVDLHRHHVKTLEDVDPGGFDLIISLSPEAHHAALELTRDVATDVSTGLRPIPALSRASAIRGCAPTAPCVTP